MEKALEYQLFFGIDSIVGGCGVRRRLRIWNVFDLAPPLLLALAGAFFCVGLLSGFLLSAHLDGAVSAEQVGLLPAAVTRLRLWSAFWSNYRWLLLSGVLALSALGVFLLYPLVLLRGFVLGFSFTTLFVLGNRVTALTHFLLTALLTCSPLLLLAASGMQRGLSELHRPPSGQSCFWGSAGIVAVLMLSAAVLTVLCCVLQLWFLPGLLGRA